MVGAPDMTAMREDADLDAVIKRIQADLRESRQRKRAGPDDQSSSLSNLQQIRGDRQDRFATFNFLLQFLVPGLFLVCVGIAVAWTG